MMGDGKVMLEKRNKPEAHVGQYGIGITNILSIIDFKSVLIIRT